jgi:hypothetical protein
VENEETQGSVEFSVEVEVDDNLWGHSLRSRFRVRNLRTMRPVRRRRTNLGYRSCMYCCTAILLYELLRMSG